MRGRRPQKIKKNLGEGRFDPCCGSCAKVLEGAVIEFNVEHESLALSLYVMITLNLLVDWLSDVDVHCSRGDPWRLVVIEQFLLR